MSETVTRQAFINLMETTGYQDFADELIARLGLAGVEEFSSDQFAMLTEAAQQEGRRRLGNGPGRDATKDEHAAALLEMLTKQAFPLTKHVPPPAGSDSFIEAADLDGL